MSDIVVTVWSDVTCPWATLALRTLHDAAERRSTPLVVDHRAFPLELINREPTPKFIVDAEAMAIASQLPELGWRRWSAPEWTYPSTVLPAMEAVQAAKAPEVGGLRASDELDAALRRAFFADSACIAIHSVILDIAATCPHVDVDRLTAALARGEGRAQVYEDLETARSPRIQGSPHLFADGGYAEHNPGVELDWTASPYDGGFPRLLAHDGGGWAEALLDRLDRSAA